MLATRQIVNIFREERKCIRMNIDGALLNRFTQTLIGLIIQSVLNYNVRKLILRLKFSIKIKKKSFVQINYLRISFLRMLSIFNIYKIL